MRLEELDECAMEVARAGAWTAMSEGTGEYRALLTQTHLGLPSLEPLVERQIESVQVVVN